MVIKTFQSLCFLLGLFSCTLAMTASTLTPNTKLSREEALAHIKNLSDDTHCCDNNQENHHLNSEQVKFILNDVIENIDRLEAVKVIYINTKTVNA